MTKSLRQKKLKKCELQKPKIKLGRKLKKAQNETKTEFRTRKIILQEQLGEKRETIFVRANMSIKDALRRLTHHNATMKQEGINALNSAIENSKDNLNPYLLEIIKGVGPCVIDKIKKTRGLAIKCFSSLTNKFQNDIDPHIETIVSYTMCAIVNLDPNIQGDSLSMVENLVNSVPSLLAKHADKLLPTFLGLISRKISDSPDSSSQIAPYTTVFNPDNKMTNLKWRLKLLSLLEKFLQSILDENERMSSLKQNVIPFQQTILGYFALSEPELNLRLLSDGDFLLNILHSILPATETTWLEAQMNIGKSSNDSSLLALKCICKILLHLNEFAAICSCRDQNFQKSQFNSAFKGRFSKSLCDNYPLVSNSVKKDKLNSEVICTDISVYICIIFQSLHLLKNYPKMKTIMAQYLSKIFDSSSNFNVENAVKASLPFYEDKFGLKKSIRDDLLKSTLERYKNSVKKSSYYLLIPKKCALQECSAIWGKKFLTEWIIYLLKLYHTQPEPSIYETLQQFKINNTTGFKDSLNNFIRENNESNIKTSMFCLDKI